MRQVFGDPFIYNDVPEGREAVSVLRAGNDNGVALKGLEDWACKVSGCLWIDEQQDASLAVVVLFEIVLAIHVDGVVDPRDAVLADLAVDGTDIERFGGANMGNGEMAQHIRPVAVSGANVEDWQDVFFAGARGLGQLGDGMQRGIRGHDAAKVMVEEGQNVVAYPRVRSRRQWAGPFQLLARVPPEIKVGVLVLARLFAGHKAEMRRCRVV